MIGRLINFAIWLIGASVLAYFVFFVPIGERTLREHAARIWATPEARELQAEVKDAANEAAERSKAQLTRDVAGTKTEP